MKLDNPSAATTSTSPELGGQQAAEQPEEQCTILDWLKAHYQPPPVHPSTLHAFELLGLEYISSFKVDEYPTFSRVDIGQRTNEIRFELFFFSESFLTFFST